MASTITTSLPAENDVERIRIRAEPPKNEAESIRRLKEELAPIISSRSDDGDTCSFVNWSGEFYANPLAIFKPHNEDQIKQILTLCRRESKRIRCFGAGHSPSDLACCDDYMLNLDKMSGLIEIDPSSKCVEVWAGTRLQDFNQIARQHNLALPVLGSISEQSVAGAISTATHGSGYNYGCISSYVRSLTLILADSTQVTVNDSEGRDLFLASLCGLGLTGVITRVKFQCEDSFNLEEISYGIPFDTFLENYSSIAQSAEHVRMAWFPQVDRVNVHLMNRTTKRRDPDTWTTALREILMWFFNWYIHPSILLVTKFFPAITDYYMIAYYHLFNKPVIRIDETKKVKEVENREKTIQHEALKHPISSSRVDDSTKVFNFDCGPPHHTYEGGIPLELTADALKEFRSFLRSEARKPNGTGLKMHFPMEIRPVDADEIWLSPSSGRKITYLGVVQFKSFGIEINDKYKKLFNAFEDILAKKYHLRSHWAKKHSQDFDSLENSFAQTSSKLSSTHDNNFHKFLHLRDQVDPDFIFCNSYISRCFVKK